GLAAEPIRNGLAKSRFVRLPRPVLPHAALHHARTKSFKWTYSLAQTQPERTHKMSVTLKDIYAPSVVTERGKPVHIGGDPKEKKRIAYCAGKGVFVRETAVRREA